MSTEEKKQIDAILIRTMFANGKGIDSIKILTALAIDVNSVRYGNKPTQIEKLLDWWLKDYLHLVLCYSGFAGLMNYLEETNEKLRIN